MTPIDFGVGLSIAGVTSMSKVRILIVEDIGFWREAISNMLRNEPSFEIVCEVADGLKAVLMAEQLQPTVVLLDIGLPLLNGMDAAGWIRKLAPRAGIVFLSEQRDTDIVQAALKLGCSYVLKSDAAKDLVVAIHSAAAGGSFMSQRLAHTRRNN
jgi:DNA-binding NarL/FixJ family response regulator